VDALPVNPLLESVLIEENSGGTEGEAPVLALMAHITAGRLPHYREPPFSHVPTRWTSEALNAAAVNMAGAFRDGRFSKAQALQIDGPVSDAALRELFDSLPPLSELKVCVPKVPVGA
jgi:hypothetical protein